MSTTYEQTVEYKFAINALAAISNLDQCGLMSNSNIPDQRIQ